MFLIKLISSNSLVELSLYFIFLMFLFHAIGRIVQNKTSFKKSVTTLSIPFGFVSYLFVTQIFYLPLIFLSLDSSVIVFMDGIKEFLIFIFIVSYYSDWIPRKNINFSNIRSFSIKISSIVILVFVFFIMSIYLDWFMSNVPLGGGGYSYNFVSGIRALSNGWSNTFNTHTNQVASGFEKYETTYYWMANVIHKTGSSATTVTNVFIPLISVVVLTLITQSFLVDVEKSIVSYFVALIVSFVFIVLLGFIGSENEYFISIVIILFISSLIFSFSMDKNPTNKPIVISLLLLIIFTTMTYFSLYIIIILGTLITFISLEKKTNYVFNVLIFLNIFFISLIIYSVLILPMAIPTSKYLYYLLITVLLYMIFVFPTYSLWNSFERKKDQQLLVNKINSSLIIYAISISVATLLSVALIENLQSLPSWKDNFIKFFDVISNKLWLSITLWLSLIAIPSILVIVYKNKIPHSSILTSIAFINLLFINPITMMFVLYIFHLKVTAYLIFFPTVLFVFLWLISILISCIPDKLRL